MMKHKCLITLLCCGGVAQALTTGRLLVDCYNVDQIFQYIYTFILCILVNDLDILLNGLEMLLQFCFKLQNKLLSQRK